MGTNDEKKLISSTADNIIATSLKNNKAEFTITSIALILSDIQGVYLIEMYSAVSMQHKTIMMVTPKLLPMRTFVRMAMIRFLIANTAAKKYRFGRKLLYKKRNQCKKRSSLRASALGYMNTEYRRIDIGPKQ